MFWRKVFKIFFNGIIWIRWFGDAMWVSSFESLIGILSQIYFYRRNKFNLRNEMWRIQQVPDAWFERRNSIGNYLSIHCMRFWYIVFSFYEMQAQFIARRRIPRKQFCYYRRCNLGLDRDHNLKLYFAILHADKIYFHFRVWIFWAVSQLWESAKL